MRDEILRAARAELAEVGPGALSMRSVARRVGVTVGALYRYFAGRDALLTELIVEAYDAVGAAAERGADGVRGPVDAWVRSGLAVREWAIGHPYEFSLIYGTPVLGYDAPERTVVSATRLLEALVGILVAGAGLGADSAESESAETARAEERELPEALRADLARVREWLSGRTFPVDAERVPARLIVGVVRAWTELIGTVSFELNGHYRNSMESGAAYLEHVLRLQAEGLGLDRAGCSRRA
ncbi:TetR/AcrR family transcriptional regulator [Gulosibacter sp. 10]|uniref:TetR/AcrR family transcriptional regulator n=1 Tax=Gulosibacter sp. 10 TaxID=1255570 RepID=UPI00097F26B8|nr:TetR/AcrR family transcriptional regulator [Gulosibacter sp. 10]SJM54441.1 Transcriptional regulator, TetR family [Gulosibacter sp. 10]